MVSKSDLMDPYADQLYKYHSWAIYCPVWSLYLLVKLEVLDVCALGWVCILFSLLGNSSLLQKEK